MYLDASTTSGNIHYVLTLDQTRDISIQKKVKTPTGSCYFNIPMNDARPYESYWAQSGNAFVLVTKLGEVPELGLVCKYGHTTISITPSYSYSKVPLSITFSSGVT